MAVCDIGKQGSTPTDEYNLSQVFIAIDVPDKEANDEAVRRIIDNIKSSEPAVEGEPILYPSEKELHIFRENVELGIPADETVWQAVLAL
jgi:3-dehydro-L-gulonate 2-dehydrogenase